MGFVFDKKLFAGKQIRIGDKYYNFGYNGIVKIQEHNVPGFLEETLTYSVTCDSERCYLNTNKPIFGEERSLPINILIGTQEEGFLYEPL